MGYTCAEYVGSEIESLAQPTFMEDGFRLVLTRDANTACVDLHDVGPAHWSLEVAMTRTNKYAVSVKDSVPGDFCYHYRGSATTLTMGHLPGVGEDACGTEWADTSPGLVFQALAEVRKGGTAILEVTISPGN